MKRLLVLCLLLLSFPNLSPAQEAENLYYKVRNKLLSVSDYIADVRIKLDVTFMKVPPLKGKLYFKSPDKMKLERNGGISILPKNSYNLTLSNLLPPGKVTVIDGGYGTFMQRKVHIIKVIPSSDTGDIVLTKISIDEANLLVLHTETTTRDNGTINMDLQFGRYINYALPDRVTFFINLKDYKLPKGVTMDYTAADDDMMKKAKGAKVKKGKVQIDYLDYKMNTGLSDDFFKEKRQ
ncbi:MAG: hypothetical protein JSS82_01470 [Bacteroidetes bacterium]|nr:hypothetical protein [Bacteroidota bacterium]